MRRASCLSVALSLALVLGAACAGGRSEEPPSQPSRTETWLLAQALGGEEAYTCRILGVQELGSEGSLGDSRLPAIGERFAVGKRSGRIVGYLDNSTYERTEVVFTPPDNAFSLIEISHGPNRAANFLQVIDWEPTKPFVYVQVGSVLSGVCD